MGKTILYRLFRVGAIPKRVRPTLENEGIILYDEGMGGAFIAKDVKGPGKRYIQRAEGFSGWLVITKTRILSYTYGKRQINISVNDPKLAQLYVDVPKEDTLSISFESSNFRDGWDGIIEFQFNTNKAAQFLDTLLSLGAQRGPLADMNNQRS